MPKLVYVYGFYNDVDPMRAFYTEQLALKETAFTDTEDWGWLAYDLEPAKLMLFRWGETAEVEGKWAWQPGETIEEAIPRMSFSIEYTPEELHDVVTRLRGAGAPTQTPDPTWRQGSYWGWTVRDPMGNTVEIFAIPAEPHTGDAPPEWKD